MSVKSAEQEHRWFTPADIAALLDGTQHGDHWRAACPAHQSDNPQSLGIAERRDQYGNPMTLLHCHAHQCAIEDICAALDIQVRNLFCVPGAYDKTARKRQRTPSPRIERLKYAANPLTSDEIAQVMLEEMIVSDPAWIQECEPARAKMWELGNASPKAHDALTRALRRAGLIPLAFWAALAQDYQGASHAND